MQLGKLNFENIGAVVIDMKKVFEFKCMDLDGIIGANQMTKAIWQIDYHDRTIIATNSISNFNIPNDAQILNFKPWGSQKTPHVMVKIGRKITDVTFDTGATTNFKFALNKYKLELDGFKNLEANGNTNTGIYGGNKVANTSYYKIPTFSIDELTLKNQIVTFTVGSSLIGNSFLKNYRVILNWQENKIYMIKVAEIDNSIFSSFGFGLRYRDGKATVATLFKNSNAEKNGILIGDQIIDVDGKDIDNLSQTDACHYAFNSIWGNKKVAVVTFLRDGRKIIHTLKKSTLLE